MRPTAAYVACSVHGLCVCVCVSVCLCVGHTGVLCKNGWTDRDVVWEADSCETNEPCSRCHCGPDPPLEGALLRGHVRSIVTYLRMSAFLIVACLRTRRKNAFTEVRCDLLPNYLKWVKYCQVLDISCLRFSTGICFGEIYRLVIGSNYLLPQKFFCGSKRKMY